MKSLHIRQHLKNMMLPISMVTGALFYPWIGQLTFLSPYFIFVMLVITYCKLEPREVKPGRLQWELLALQLVMSVVAYFSLCWWNHIVAEGVFICVFIPTATAAPVITSMLGGSLSKLVTFSLISNLSMSVLGPLILALIGDNADMSFLHSFALIASKVFPLLVGPMVLAFLIKWLFPAFHSYLSTQQMWSFYLWAVSLLIVVGSSVAFAINNFTEENGMLMLWLALGALAVCLAQFKLGRMLGGRFGDKVSAGQGLGQKNTVLAIWIALVYMNPIASIAPAAYVAWQNIINSWQIARHNSRLQKQKPLV